MKDIATFFAILSVLILYIAMFAEPVSQFLHKRNILNHKSRLFLLYSLIAMAIFVSVFNPEISIVTSATDVIRQTSIGEKFFNFRAEAGAFLGGYFESEETYYTFAMLFLSGIGFIGLALYALSFATIATKIIGLKKYRRIGRITLLLEKKKVTPHVFSAFGRSYVVLPESVIANKSMLLTSVKHEFQHIRNGDTHSIYILHLMRCLLWINPAIHFISSQIKSLQEIRVDENLIHEKKIGYKKYLTTLNWFIDNGQNTKSFGLSYSIFGWSTFRELRNRVQNITRVRPVRSQPALFGLLFTMNVFVLLIIANSTPKFNYSIRDLQRMLMPEYMKKEFKLTYKNDFTSSPDDSWGIRTIEFARESEIESGAVHIQIDCEDDHYKSDEMCMAHEARSATYKKGERPRPWVTMLRHHVKVKVIEYTDKDLVVSIDADTYPLDKNIDYAKLTHQQRQSVKIKTKKDIRLPYGGTFNIEGMNITFKVESHSPTVAKKSLWEKRTGNVTNIAQGGPQ